MGFSCLPSLLSLAVSLLARLEQSRETACRVLKFAFEGPFFRWKKKVQTELPKNPTSTFSLTNSLSEWHFKAQSPFYHSDREPVFIPPLKSISIADSHSPSKSGKELFCLRFYLPARRPGVQVGVPVKDTELVKQHLPRLRFARAQRAVGVGE